MANFKNHAETELAVMREKFEIVKAKLTDTLRADGWCIPDMDKHNLVLAEYEFRITFTRTGLIFCIKKGNTVLSEEEFININNSIVKTIRNKITDLLQIPKYK